MASANHLSWRRALLWKTVQSPTTGSTATFLQWLTLLVSFERNKREIKHYVSVSYKKRHEFENWISGVIYVCVVDVEKKATSIIQFITMHSIFQEIFINSRARKQNPGSPKCWRKRIWRKIYYIGIKTYYMNNCTVKQWWTLLELLIKERGKERVR